MTLLLIIRNFKTLKIIHIFLVRRIFPKSIDFWVWAERDQNGRTILRTDFPQIWWKLPIFDLKKIWQKRNSYLKNSSRTGSNRYLPIIFFNLYKYPLYVLFLLIPAVWLEKKTIFAVWLLSQSAKLFIIKRIRYIFYDKFYVIVVLIREI